MNKLIATLSLFLVVATLPSVVFAGPIIRSGETISVDANQTLKGDFYGFASTITLSGGAEDDVYLAGGTVTVNAPVEHDLVVAGGVVQVHGDVQDDVRVIGGEVTLGKVVKGDVVVMGGTLTILSTASIEGDVLFLGGNLVIEGNVVGGVHANADTIRINSEIGGDVLLTAQSRFALGDKAKILGNVTYESYEDVIRAQDAQVVGEMRKTEVAPTSGSEVFRMYIMIGLALMFAALSIHFVSRKHMQQLMEDAARHIGVSGLVGLGILLVTPFVGMVLLVSMLGAFLGAILFAAYISMLVIALALAGVLIGHLMEKYLFKKYTITLSTILMGITVLIAAGFIPVVGPLVILASIVVVLGGLGMSFHRSVRG